MRSLLRLLAFVLLSFVIRHSAHAATFTVSGTTLQLNLTAANEAVAITAGASSYTFALTGGTWSGTDSADATGNGTASLSAVKASFTAVTVDDASTGNSANFNDSGANTYDASFTVTMDSASPGGCTMSGTTAFTGSAALSVQAGAVAMISATISTVNGHLTLLGNMQIPEKTGNSNGVNINGSTVSVSGSGDLTIKGTSGISTATQMGVRLQGASIITGGTAGTTLTIEGYGAASSATNYGLDIKDAGTTVTTNGGNVVVKGVGGTASTTDNKGVLLEPSTSILATGSGSITVTGTGGGANTSQNAGVELQTGSQIASANGNVSVTGTGGGAGTGGTNRGVVVSGSIKSTGSGDVVVTGTGGPGTGGDNQGVLMERNGSGTVQEIKSGTGNVTVTGTAGGGSNSLGIKVNSVAAAAATISTSAPGVVSLIADSMSLVTSAVISAPTVSIAPKTVARNMDLGSTSDSIPNTLALSQTELNTITASTLNLGDVNTAVINLSANLTRPAGTTTNLTAAVINFNAFTFTGGTINQVLTGQPIMTVEQPAGTAIVSGVTKSFGNVAVGSTADLVFTVKNSGSGNLTGLTITGLSGTDFSVVASPAAPVAPAGSTSFTLRFTPTGSSGLKTASLSLASNALAMPSFVINLAGNVPFTGPISGALTVGPTGFYASLTQAVADIQVKGIGGPIILELEPAYVSTVETFPLTIPALAGASAVNTLTIRPASGATALSISSADTTAATVDLNGAQFVTFDGRPGGTGTAKQLTIENTSTAGVALRFINEGSNNTIKFVTLKGVNTGSSSTVLFSTTTGANGNDNNIIDTCDIRDGASTQFIGIWSLGTTTTTAQNNSGNTVTNCNFFNFRLNGVQLAGGNTDWTISGNSFYQTATRGATTLTVIPISIVGGNNFTVTGNFIGGSAPNCGGTAWTTTGTTTAYLFLGIRLSVGNTTPSSVQGNTIANIVWTSNSNATTLPGVWSGIYVQAGNVNVGTVTGNTIGSGTGTGSISVTTSGTGGTSFGIGSASSDTVAIANNSIGSITTIGSGVAISASLVGIQVTAGANTISNNTVGSSTTANSLNASNSGTSQQVTGIFSSSTGGASITGNTVANLNNTAGSAGQIRGIVTSAGVNTITGNTVRNLSTTSQNNNTTTAQSVYGIIATSTTAGQTVSQNTVHSLANTATSAAVSVTGIYFAGPTSGTNVIARNFVHSLAVSSSSSSVLHGMQFVAGTFTAQNNMVRVGLKADGTSTAGASLVRGIYDNGTTAGRNFYHNSVYIGGVNTSQNATVGSAACAGLTGVSNARTYQNNIFVNARTNSGGTGKHYAVIYGGSGVNPTGLTAGGNLFLASGTGGVFGLYNSADVANLAAWQAATGQDATSAVGDPLFVTPAGTSATVDLHLQASNPAEGGGIPLTDAATGAPVTVTDDFDGQTRSTLTPVDVGADAGNFTLTSDLFAPGIRYPLLTSGSTANRVLTGWATITDNSGSVSGGANAPRLYFKKSTDADVFGVANDSTGNGWKYVTGTDAGGGSYSFTLDYALINGGSVTAGDTVQYFVVAQDAANNLGSSPAGATASANPPVQNVNGHGAVNSFSILGPISGTVTVGSGGTYPSLSGAGGLFAALNASVLTGNVVVNITSDLTETGGVTLNEFSSAGYPFDTYTLTLQPDSATMRTISGTATAGLITLNGADRVTIDGRFGGSGRYLTFRNTSAVNTSSTLLFQNDSSNNIVRNCVVEGATTSISLGVIGFGSGTVTGNNNNLITACQVRDRSDAAGGPNNLIASLGTATISNRDNTVSNNECFNFSGTAILVGLTGNANWTVSGNEIYDVNLQNGAAGIAMNAAGTNTVTQNSIHDLQSSGTGVTGIGVNSAGSTTVARNRIVLTAANAANTSFIGININGITGSAHSFINNQITIIPNLTLTASVRGISDNSPAGSNTSIFHNTVVVGGTASGASNTWCLLRQSPGTHVSRNNIFLNVRSGGTGNYFATGNESSLGATGFTASNNVYAGTGATAASFMDFGNGSATAVSYATWQTSTGDTSPSASNPGGDYSTAMFVNAATGDLHLVPGGNVLVNGAGTPIAGVTDDFDGDLRSLTTPIIGADEIVLAAPDIAVTQTSAVVDGGSINFGNVTLGSSSAAKTVTITNPGTADLTSLAFATADGTNPGDFTVSALSGTSIPVGSGTVTFTVTFTPSASGARSAGIHITSNVAGTKNPYDIVLTGTGQTLFQAWATANSTVANNTTLPNFAFGTAPGVTTALVYTGTFAGGGAITATGVPITAFEPTTNGVDFRALFVRRKDYVAAGLTYTVQFSANLTTWVDSTEVPTVLADDGVNQIVSVPYPPFVGGKKARFFQVTVSIAP